MQTLLKFEPFPPSVVSLHLSPGRKKVWVFCSASNLQVMPSEGEGEHTDTKMLLRFSKEKNKSIKFQSRTFPPHRFEGKRPRETDHNISLPNAELPLQMTFGVVVGQTEEHVLGTITLECQTFLLGNHKNKERRGIKAEFQKPTPSDRQGATRSWPLPGGEFYFMVYL